MTVVAATASAYLTALEAALRARPALADVQIELTYPKDALVRDAIVLIADVIREDRLYVNNVRQRESIVEITGLVQVRSSIGFLDALERAGLIGDELEEQVTKHPIQVGRQTRVVDVSSFEWLPAAMEAGGWACRGYFTISYATRLT